MRKLIFIALLTGLLVSMSTISFAWSEGATINKVKKTPANLTYLTITFSNNAKASAYLAPTMENQLLAVALTAVASGQKVDVNIVADGAGGYKITGLAINE
jgi:hypothetical protein